MNKADEAIEGVALKEYISVYGNCLDTCYTIEGDIDNLIEELKKVEVDMNNPCIKFVFGKFGITEEDIESDED